MSDALEAEFAALRGLSRKQLVKTWCGLFKAAPPLAYTSDLLRRGIAWRMQERALGGLSAQAKALLAPVAKGRGAAKASALLRPGNRLVRRWRGRTYVVEVREGGLSYEGERYGSLSEIAGKITGTRWSGPRFFGLPR